MFFTLSILKIWKILRIVFMQTEKNVPNGVQELKSFDHFLKKAFEKNQFVRILVFVNVICLVNQ